MSSGVPRKKCDSSSRPKTRSTSAAEASYTGEKCAGTVLFGRGSSCPSSNINMGEREWCRYATWRPYTSVANASAGSGGRRTMSGLVASSWMSVTRPKNRRPLVPWMTT